MRIEWSPHFAYAVGLLVTDGSLSKDGRHIILVSKDLLQLLNFKKALNINNSIGHTRSGYNGKLCTRVQFGDVMFYKFLLYIGLMPNKTKTIGSLKIPQKYFFDFLRGHFDGDGSTYSYFDPRWKSSFMFYTAFVSASKTHVLWLQEEIRKLLGIHGYITGSGKRKSVYQLKYAKAESLRLLRKMYYSKNVMHLSRKRLKVEKMMRIVGEFL